ncbi:MAG: HIT family protein [Chitinophagales bacterium]|nr:HIT family protein [Chitinophagales bacterium]
MPSIFTKIINGEIPSYKIAEDDNFYAFLDIRPLHLGHTLVVPKQEIDYIFDIDDDLLAKMIVFAKKVALAIQKAVPCERIGMTVIGLEVPHAHIHLSPINTIHDLNFSNTKQYSLEEMQDIAQKISGYL